MLRGIEEANSGWCSTKEMKNEKDLVYTILANKYRLVKEMAMSFDQIEDARDNGYTVPYETVLYITTGSSEMVKMMPSVYITECPWDWTGDRPSNFQVERFDRRLTAEELEDWALVMLEAVLAGVPLEDAIA